MKLPHWLRLRTSRPAPAGVRRVDFTFTADMRPFIASMNRAARSIGALQERMAWRRRLAEERRAARRWLDAEIDAAWARYGWERPQ